MRKKYQCSGVSKEVAKNLSKKLLTSLTDGDLGKVQEVCLTAIKNFIPQGVLQFPIGTLPSSGSNENKATFNPDREALVKLYSKLATNVWRIRNQVFDAENVNEPKEFLSAREVGKVVRYVNSLETALSEGGVEIVSDYIGKQHHEGSAVKVVSYENRQDLKRDEYVEVLMPTVRWTDPDGHTALLQPAEVVVGRPVSPAV